MQNKIYELSLSLLQNPNYFTDHIINNTKVNYYWSRDWSEEFYIALAKLGFISTSYDTEDGLILLPELQFEYALLDFKNLHINSKVKKLLREDNFYLLFNTNFDITLTRIQEHHSRYNWLKGDYLTLMKKIHNNYEKYPDFKLYSVELISKEDGALVAGEIGYAIGETYTSLTGFSSREKKHNNCGKLQLIYLAKHLEKKGFMFWNFGHPHMQYKKDLGTQIYSREEFLARWKEATYHKKLKDL